MEFGSSSLGCSGKFHVLLSDTLDPLGSFLLHLSLLTSQNPELTFISSPGSPAQQP
jgi:hypothetical protein